MIDFIKSTLFMKFKFLGTYIPYLLIGILLLPFFVTCLFAHPTYDDYWVYTVYQDLGLWGAIKHWYISWTGRYSAMFIALASSPLNLEQLDYYGIHCLIYFILFFLALFCTLSRMFSKLNKKEFGFLILGFSYLLLLYLPSSFEFFYYLAVVYNYNIAFICIGIILTLLSEEAIFESKIRFVIIVLLLIFATGINEISSLIIVFFAFVLITLSLLKRKPNKLGIIRLAIISFILIVSSTILLFAPGNFNRMNVYPKVDVIVPISVSIKNALIYCLYNLKSLIVQGPFLLLLIPAFYLKTKYNDLFIVISKNRIYLLIWVISVSLVYYMIALMAVIGYKTSTSLPQEMATPQIRNFQLLYFLMVFPLTFALILDFFRVPTFKSTNLISCIFIIFISFYTLTSKNTIANTIIDLKENGPQSCDEQTKAIYDHCKRNQGADILVSKIKNTSNILKCYEFQKDSSNLYNQFFANYHNVKSIKLK
jgi:hypothetical protein